MLILLSSSVSVFLKYEKPYISSSKFKVYFLKFYLFILNDFKNSIKPNFSFNWLYRCHYLRFNFISFIQNWIFYPYIELLKNWNKKKKITFIRCLSYKFHRNEMVLILKAYLSTQRYEFLIWKTKIQNQEFYSKHSRHQSKRFLRTFYCNKPN
jgi:hypothetical protein